MLSKTVDERLRYVAEAVWLRFNIVLKKEGRNWLSHDEVLHEVRQLFSHSKTRRLYFQMLLDYGFLKERPQQGKKSGTTCYVPVDPSIVETRTPSKYIDSLRKQLHEVTNE
jgi:hypothetical protein